MATPDDAHTRAPNGWWGLVADGWCGMSTITAAGTVALETSEFEKVMGRVPLLVDLLPVARECGTPMGPQIHGGRAVYWCRSTCGDHLVAIDVLDRWVWREVTRREETLPTSLDDSWRRRHTARLVTSVTVSPGGSHITWRTDGLLIDGDRNQ